MKQLLATYSVVTPMFLGGANPESGKVGFRPPSFKGALRFWWRALEWAQVAQAGNDINSSLRELHRRESDLFGSAAGESGSRQSRVLLAADWKPGTKLAASDVRSSGKGGQENGTAYLMGQGLARRSASGGGQVELSVCFKPGTSKEHRQSVERALLVVGLLGGLGSRARRGFGSLAIEKLEGDRSLDLEAPTTLEEVASALDALIGRRAAGSPPYSAFSTASRIDSSLTGSSAARVHGDLGRRMQEFRQALTEDTRRARSAANGQRPDQAPERAVFGLPLQFYFKRDDAKVFVEPAARAEDKIDRRASPLLIHVHLLPGEHPARRFVAIQAFLPARFLPRGIGVRVKAPQKPTHDFRGFSPRESLITEYLDSFEDRRSLLS